MLMRANFDRIMTPYSCVSNARFRVLLTLCVSAALILSGPAGHACTRVFWNDNSIAKVVGRNADWFEAQTDPRAASDPKLLVLPRGLSKSGAMNSRVCPLVDPLRMSMPPEPFRWAGGSVIDRALIRRDKAEDTGKNPGVLVAAVAGLPRRLGWRLPR